jgi:hypothetical protein
VADGLSHLVSSVEQPAFGAGGTGALILLIVTVNVDELQLLLKHNGNVIGSVFPAQLRYSLK